MSLKRSEAEVVGHDTAVHAAIDELTEGRRGVDPLYDGNPKAQRKQPVKDHANLYRFHDVTVPPGVAEKMAEVNLHDVDEGKQAKEEDETTVVVPRRSISPWFLVGLLAVVVIALLAWIAIPKGTPTKPSAAATQSAARVVAPPPPSARPPEGSDIAHALLTASELVAPAEPTELVPPPATTSKPVSTAPSTAKAPNQPATTPTSDATSPPATSASPKKPDFVIPEVEF